jgi:predicted amidophosphoribosyltransferase
VTISVEGGTELQTVRRCSRCEAVNEDRYCACCGNELDRPHDLSTKQFLKEALVAVTDVNSALIASFLSLVMSIFT